ncbi:spore coat protein [Cohnella pontilimi]|uniref:spore coat protein n=1 Tax=Cohnella pontilimi TaxID=2564100 RepID=UPI001B802C21|nr:spore coat protein [Cohnella pontilimi]
MPFGAHETMETHEILSEKINCITHFHLYAREAKHPQLRDMIARHQQEAIASYNQLVAYTHDYIPFRPISPNTDLQGVKPQSVQYGLHNPQPMAPQADSMLSDREIAMAMLWCHKNGARNCSSASLEAADPNLRQMMMNCAAACTNSAYEVFLFMNEHGVYQVPTLNDHTAKTLLHSYQPSDSSLNAQYSVQGGQQMWQQQPWQQHHAQQHWQQPVQRSPESWQQSWAQVGSAGGHTGYGAAHSTLGSYNQANPNVGAGTSGNPLNAGSANSVTYGHGGAGMQSQSPSGQNQTQSQMLNQSQTADSTESIQSDEEGGSMTQ